MRNFPHYPLAFDELRSNGYCKHMFLTPDKQGLVEVVNCGFGFVLIKTDVFRALEQPWVRLGELDLDGWCDDIGFFNRVQAAGFKIYCDLSIYIGHTINLILWPRLIDGVWYTIYVIPTGQQFQFPQSLLRSFREALCAVSEPKVLSPHRRREIRFSIPTNLRRSA